MNKILFPRPTSLQAASRVLLLGIIDTECVEPFLPLFIAYWSCSVAIIFASAAAVSPCLFMCEILFGKCIFSSQNIFLYHTDPPIWNSPARIGTLPPDSHTFFTPFGAPNFSPHQLALVSTHKLTADGLSCAIVFSSSDDNIM